MVSNILLWSSLLATASQVANAVQVANFNVSAETALDYGCDAACYEYFSYGLEYDAVYFGSLYDEDFYATADNFSTSSPGDLLKFQPIDPANLSEIPDGTTSYRFQYVSVDVFGNAVPATGFIAFPYAGRSNDHKFGTIAWAHGTSGVFRGCAPSAMPNLYEYDSWAYLINRGYAVVATDYAGLGNNYTAHQYFALSAQANDLYYSVVAARKLFGAQLSDEWMSVGHSQGGGAVWTLAESDLLREDPLNAGTYLGTVAQAPGLRGKDLATQGYYAALNGTGTDNSRAVLGELGWGAFGLHRVIANESFAWVHEKFRKRLALAELAQACYLSMELLVADLEVDDVFNISDASFQAEFAVSQNNSLVGQRKSEQPVLVVQGLADVSVYATVTELSYEAACEYGNVIQMQYYPGLDHVPVIAGSAPSFLQWIDDRFAGKTVPCSCTNTTIQPFDATYMYAPADTD
ncbi:hypothetical protein G7054_g9170 [Neopestalotiopsis clavispora]|nr:hypothetical protein G7054_g9170 [Neopestalotiopsis clavispora]